MIFLCQKPVYLYQIHYTENDLHRKLILFFNSLADCDSDVWHVFLTWLWICVGGLVQFVVVSYNIRKQDYLPSVWKWLVVVASAALLGPTMFYCFGLVLIISFKRNLLRAPLTESQLMGIIERTSAAACQAKLAEIFFESIPQFLTQLLMTSAKGREGVKGMTSLQLLSVVSSSCAISFGISKHILDCQGAYVSRKHSKMASRLVFIFFIISEIAFCGGICRFAFAFLGRSHSLYIAIMIPFIAVSSFLALAPMIMKKFQSRVVAFIFLIYKLFIWVSIVGVAIYQAISSGLVQALIYSNCMIIFVTTMTLTCPVNFVSGYLIHKRKTSLRLYTWFDLLLTKIAGALTERNWFEASVIEEMNTREADVGDIEVLELSELKTDLDKLTAADKNAVAKMVQDLLGRNRGQQSINHSQTEAINFSKNCCPNSRSSSSCSTIITDSMPSIMIGSQIPSEDTISVEPSKPKNEEDKTSRPTFKGKVCGDFATPLTIITVLGAILLTLFLCPLELKTNEYHVEFYKECITDQKDGGFPVVSDTNTSQRGFICIEERPPIDILRIAVIVAKQLKIFPHFEQSSPSEYVFSTLLVGAINYKQHNATDGSYTAQSLKDPYLQPMCTGKESNLAKCKQFGLKIGLNELCEQTDNRFYMRRIELKIGEKTSNRSAHRFEDKISNERIRPSHSNENETSSERILSAPRHFYVFFEEAVDFSNAKTLCGGIPQFDIGGLEETKYPVKVSRESHLLHHQDLDIIPYLSELNWRGLWLQDGKYVERKNTLTIQKQLSNQTLPFVCKVYNGFYYST